MASGALVQNITEEDNLVNTESGRTVPITVTDDGTASGSAINLSAISLKYYWIDRYTGAEVLELTTVGGGITISGASSNIATAALGDLSAIDPDRYRHYLQNVDSDFLYMRGDVRLLGENPV